MSISAADVKKLRDMTGAGMMDAKKALSETDGDFDSAVKYLREKGLADSKKRADKEANQGTIGDYIHFQQDRAVAGVLVELVVWFQQIKLFRYLQLSFVRILELVRLHHK